MNRALFFDIRRAWADADIHESDGIDRWTETVRYGGQLYCSLNGRHLAKVLRAKQEKRAA